MYTALNTPTYHGPMLNQIGTSTERRLPYTPTFPYDERKNKLSELESLVRMYSSLKTANSPQDLLQPMEDTIKRLTAEIFYLDTNQ